MKAQSFFGTGKTKQTGEKVRQVGHTGSVQNKTTSIGRKTEVKQAYHQGQPGGVNIQRKTTAKQAYTLGSRGESLNDKGRTK